MEGSNDVLKWSDCVYGRLTTVGKLDLPRESNVLSLMMSETMSKGSEYSGESDEGSDPSVVYFMTEPGAIEINSTVWDPVYNPPVMENRGLSEELKTVDP